MRKLFSTPRRESVMQITDHGDVAFTCAMRGQRPKVAPPTEPCQRSGKDAGPFAKT